MITCGCRMRSNKWSSIFELMSPANSAHKAAIVSPCQRPGHQPLASAEIEIPVTALSNIRPRHQACTESICGNSKAQELLSPPARICMCKMDQVNRLSWMTERYAWYCIHLRRSFYLIYSLAFPSPIDARFSGSKGT